MKRTLSFFAFIIFMLVFSISFLNGCSEKFDINDITFESATFVYDGSEHAITISNNPFSTYSVVYSNNTLTNVGETKATAIFYNKKGKEVGSLSASLVITALEIEEPKFDKLEFVYTGSECKPNILNDSEYVSLDYTSQTNTGEYKIKVSLNDKNNTVWKNNKNTNDLEYTWHINNAIALIPSTNLTTFTYDGEVKTLSLAESNLYSISGNVQTNAGEYNAIISLNDKDNYTWEDGTKDDILICWSINKQTIEIPNINNTLFVYDGNIHSLEISSSHLFTVSNNEYKNAGSYKTIVSLIDKDNYIWSNGQINDLEYNWTITKKNIELPSLTNSIVYYNGENQEFVLTNNTYCDISLNVNKNVGTYHAIVTLKDKENYQWINGSSEEIYLEYSIKPYEIDKPTLKYTSYAYTGVEINVYSDTSNYYTVTGNTNTFKDTYVITFTLNDKDNYIWKNSDNNDISIEYTISDNGLVSISDFSTKFTYEEIDPSIFSNKYYYVSGAKQIDLGTYEAIASLIDKTNNFWSDGSINDKTIKWTIEKGNLDLSNIKVLDTTYTYDGLAHTIDIEGDIPSYLDVIIENDKQINAGTYTVTVSFKTDVNGFLPILEKKTATLTINKATFDINTIKFEDKEYTFDESEHVLLITGTLPEGISANYVSNKATRVGTYNASVTFSTNSNYNAISDKLSAKLTIEKATFDINKISFENLECTYDGSIHELTYSGYIPTGISAKITGDYSKINAGTYDASLVFTVIDTDSYNPITENLTAKLIINKANYDLSNIKFESKEFVYDTLSHSLAVEGTLPNGLSVNLINNSLTGKYNEETSQEVIAKFKNASLNYNDVSDLVAKITIKPSNVKLSVHIDEKIEEVLIYKYSTIANMTYKAVKTDYKLVGYTDINGNYYASDYVICDNIDLYAVFKECEFKVLFDPNGGYLSDDDNVLLIDTNDTYNLPIPTYNDKNYKFIGWYDLDNNNSTKFVSGTWDYKVGTQKEYHLVAMWEYIGEIKEGVYFKATKDKIIISINNLTSTNGGFAKMLVMNPSAYYFKDTDKGVSKNKISDETNYLFKYLEGTKQVITLDRYTIDNIDLFLQKYYLVNDGIILKGPMYFNDVESENEIKTDIDTNFKVTKKGLTSGSYYFLNNLSMGCSFIGISFNGAILPNEVITSSGKEKAIDWSTRTEYTFDGTTYYKENYEPFVYNGTTYYFKKDSFSFISNYVKAISDIGCKTAISILMKTTTDQFSCPYYLQYSGAGEMTKIPYMALNTSNEKGANYYAALVSYLASKYSTKETGYLTYIVLGNEIDYPTEWNVMNNSDAYDILSFEKYSEEYYRTLRITANVLRKYNNYSTVLIPYTHSWNYSGNGSSGYKPYDLTESFIKKANEQGNFYFGLASHSYSVSLASVESLYDDIKDTWGITYDVDTKFITMANLEVYDLYLDRDGYYQPDGSIRPVLINELGVSTGQYPYTSGTDLNAERRQAATIAYTYFKSEMLKSVVGFAYFDLQDSASIPTCSFGLVDYAFSKKLSFNMYIDLDSVDTNTYTSFLPYVRYFNRNTSSDEYFTSDDTYLSAIKKTSNSIGSNDIDWDNRWNEMIKRLGIK